MEHPTSNSSEGKPTARGKPSAEGRFAWQSSLALERIVNELGQTQAAFGVAVYVALTRLSSREKGNPSVQASVSKIAGAARIGYRKTLETLHELESKAKVISIEKRRVEGTKEHDESIYTLLSTRLPRRNNTSFPLGRTGSSCDVVPPRTASHAENPKESPGGRDIKREDASPAAGHAVAGAPQSASSAPKGANEW